MSKINFLRIASYLGIDERELESLHLLLPFHGLFSSANAGADASVSGSRFGRVWEQVRSRLGAGSDASGTMFADKYGICIVRQPQVLETSFFQDVQNIEFVFQLYQLVFQLYQY